MYKLGGTVLRTNYFKWFCLLGSISPSRDLPRYCSCM